MAGIVTYKNLEWYVINETDKEKLLFLKDSFTNEQILKYFTDKSMVDEYCDVQYSKEISPWFVDSYIRTVLNGPFLNDLDKNDLNVMKTTLMLKNKSSTSIDYVRLITEEEIKHLQKTNIEVLNIGRKHGYWTMSPYFFTGSDASVAVVYDSSHSESYNFVYGTSTVRPIISLKPEGLKSEVSLENDELRKAILKFRKRTRG